MSRKYSSGLPPIGRLHLITDTTVQDRYSHAELAEQAIAGGVDTIQYRSKGNDFPAMLREAERTAGVCRSHGVLFLVNDRVDLALAVGADGVHLGQTDMPLAIARRILGPERVIGGTVRNVSDLQQATADGADYVGLGPVFPTASKNVDHLPLGLDAVAMVAARAMIPIIAIAGINAGNVAEVMASGAYGIAVIGAIASAADVRAAAEMLRGRMGPQEQIE